MHITKESTVILLELITVKIIMPLFEIAHGAVQQFFFAYVPSPGAFLCPAHLQNRVSLYPHLRNFRPWYDA
jgi:hypothetical protein